MRNRFIPKQTLLGPWNSTTYINTEDNALPRLRQRSQYHRDITDDQYLSKQTLVHPVSKSREPVKSFLTLSPSRISQHCPSTFKRPEKLARRKQLARYRVGSDADEQSGELSLGHNFITSAKDRNSLYRNLLKVSATCNKNEGNSTSLLPKLRQKKQECERSLIEITNQKITFASYLGKLKSLKLSKCIPLRIKPQISTK